jgi:inositol transport system ATP-binding protein
MSQSYVLQVRNLSKSFPGVKALAGIQLDVEEGRVHALMGENGAGKSTLVKILAGLDTPDTGTILFKGRPIRLRNPHDALRRGIAMIHQELMPFLDLNVAENIFMGQQPASRFLGWIDRPKLNADVRRLLESLGTTLSPAQRMRDLSVGEMQAVEIAKAIAHRAEVIIMDEPTSAISDREVERLFGIIRDLRQRGVAVIYISHKLEEVFRIADTVTVLRDGFHVATGAVGDWNADKLIASMIGRELCEVPPRAEAQASVPNFRWSPGSEAPLAVRDLGKAGRFRGVFFHVRCGEVLGLAGLMGAGRTDVVSAIYGLAPADAGQICVHGRTVRIRSPRDAIRHGIGMVSEDRKEFGLVLPMGVKHNLTLTELRRCCRGWFIDHGAENRVADERMAAFAIKAVHRNQPVNLLSGGNQQKVVIAKALLAEPQVLILDEPTRGIDIGAKAEVYTIISQLARAGKAVILVSSELPELLSLSDRILVMREGVVSAELDARRTTAEEILKFAMPN